MWDRFAFSVAIRQLRFGIAQSLLTVGVVGISITLIIFVASLIGGLQQQLIQTITGALPNINIVQPERVPIGAWEVPELQEEGRVYIGTRRTLMQRTRSIEDWQVWVNRLQVADRRIIAVSPVVEGQAIVSSGATQRGVIVTGVLPERHNQVVDIESGLSAGRFFGLRTGEVALGEPIAEELGVGIGDRVRVVTSEGASATYRVAGIFSTGFPVVDEGTVFLTLRDGQSLTGLGNAVTSIALKLSDIFQANDVAEGLRAQVPYDVESWMEEYQNLLVALRSQSQTSALILVFVTVAAGFGIASILITAVTSKQKEIGILRAIGATRRQIIGLFTLQSTLMATVGGIVGTLLGIALSIGLYRWRLSITPPERRDELFPIALTTELVLGSLAIAVAIGFVASIYPAWRAARVNPIEVIRGQ